MTPLLLAVALNVAAPAIRPEAVPHRPTSGGQTCQAQILVHLVGQEPEAVDIEGTYATVDAAAARAEAVRRLGYWLRPDAEARQVRLIDPGQIDDLRLYVFCDWWWTNLPPY